MTAGIFSHESRVEMAHAKILRQLPEDVQRQWSVHLLADPAFIVVRVVFASSRNPNRRYEATLSQDGTVPDETTSLLCLG